jgi:hypothetical protein
MKPAHGIALVLASAVWAVSVPVAPASEPEKNIPLTLTLYDSHGLSADSAADHVLEIILFKSNTHIHLKISNTTDHGLILWRPYCPQGDAAMNIEFRQSAVPDKVLVAHAGMGYAYTAGMGNPTVFTLAPRDDLIVNVDFLNEWNLPFAMKAAETREFEMRAVYRSESLTEDKFKQLFGTEEMEHLYGTKEMMEHVLGTKEIRRVWSGIAASKWQKVRVINRTGTTAEAK